MEAMEEAGNSEVQTIDGLVVDEGKSKARLSAWWEHFLKYNSPENGPQTPVLVFVLGQLQSSNE